MWRELGIEPTADATAIRRAYARRLKMLDPDLDKDAFQSLRRAYDAALARAAPHDGAPPPEAAPASPRRAAGDRAGGAGRVSTRHDPEPQPAHVRAELERSLDQADARQALALLDEALATGAVPLVADERFIDRLTTVVTQDWTLPAETFDRLLRIFGWHDYGAATISAPVADAIGRLEAAKWYAELLARAQPRRFGWRATDTEVVRIMLGRQRPPLLLTGDAALRLRVELAQFDTYGPWLEGRFNPSYMARLRNLAGRDVERWIRERIWPVIIISFAMGVLFCFSRGLVEKAQALLQLVMP